MQGSPTRRDKACSLEVTNGLKPSAYREPIKSRQRQVEKRADPALQELEGPDEGFCSVHIGAFDGCRVLDCSASVHSDDLRQREDFECATDTRELMPTERLEVSSMKRCGDLRDDEGHGKDFAERLQRPR
jgi:hypothetical protein